MKIREPIYPEPGKLYDDDQEFRCPDCEGPMIPAISGGRIFYEVEYVCLNPECRSVAIFHDGYDGTKRLPTTTCIETWLADGPHYPAAESPDQPRDNRSRQWEAARREKK